MNNMSEANGSWKIIDVSEYLWEMPYDCSTKITISINLIVDIHPISLGLIIFDIGNFAL